MDLFSNIEEDIRFYKNIFNKKLNHKNIWQKRSRKFINSLIKNNGNLNLNFLKNFRSHKKKFIAENPSIEINNFLKEKLYSHHIEYNKYLYKKLTKNNPEQKKIMKSFKLDNVGNPGYCEIDGLKINERFLRHCHFYSLFKKFFPKNKIEYVTDIGGGYGSFAKMIHSNFKKVKILIIDLPEQLFTAKYYLSTNFPETKISSLKDIYLSKKIDKKFLSKYEIVLIPNTELHKIKINFKKNLVINFNSFGEMDRESFFEYFKSNLLTKSKYLFSINRLDSFPTYKNNISFINYGFDNYKKIHYKISPVWDIYFIKELYLLKKEKYFTSRILEFIGEK